jgi:hypothetical protein
MANVKTADGCPPPARERGRNVTDAESARAGIYVLAIPRVRGPEEVDFEGILQAARAVGTHAESQLHGAVTIVHGAEHGLWTIQTLRYLERLWPTVATATDITHQMCRLESPERFLRLLLSPRGVIRPHQACMVVMAQGVRLDGARRLLAIEEGSQPLIADGDLHVFYGVHPMPPAR